MSFFFNQKKQNFFHGQAAQMCAEMTPALWTLSVSADKHPECVLLVTCANDLSHLGLSAATDPGDEATGKATLLAPVVPTDALFIS